MIEIFPDPNDRKLWSMIPPYPFDQGDSMKILSSMIPPFHQGDSMKILIVGSGGSMGCRYTAILKSLQQEIRCYDIKTGDPVRKDEMFDRAIIASPTKFHIKQLRTLIPRVKYILCEKPICFDPTEIMDIYRFAKEHDTDVRMVCNWSYAHPRWSMLDSDRYYPKKHTICYNNYNTGPHGLYWDCIQLVYLAKNWRNLDLRSDAPYPRMQIDNNVITLDLIARSYIRMIRAWLENPQELWDLKDAFAATNEVLKLVNLTVKSK